LIPPYINNSSQVSNVDSLRTSVINSLYDYSENIEINRFGGRFKYSKLIQVIDRVNNAISSNITKVIIRRDMKALINRFAQYELCFGNKFHINSSGLNIKSTGFYVQGELEKVYLTDVPNKDEYGNLDGSGKGVISIIANINENNNYRVVIKSVGTVDYNNGEIKIGTINITSTDKPNNIIEIQAYPESNDVVGLKDLYLSFNVENSKINMIRDVISSGEDTSGSTFIRDYYTSSYSNGNIERE